MTARSLANSYWPKRILRHILLAFSAAILVCIVYAATPPPDFRHRLSMATAYASMIFLAACLALGPWNLLRRQSNPVSFDLRRDTGIWAGILALIHTAIGLNVHLRGRMWMYFFKSLHPLRIQNTQFGLANYVGLGAALLFVMLLAISNNLSIRSFGTQRWKSLQRWTYIAALLTVLHGFLFQAVEHRRWQWVMVYCILIATGIGFQAAGFLCRVKQRADNRR